ncbi:hypothetical protein SELMODRAFT_413916 [Selaginella moellendorffii]|uniref:Integrase core domain-containing protein n=1 Tax=Selaginella moellendorffii TaxID=88036 RepID=D8RR15_SELML|nr:hypothetical protein SELMODRAFT_413916 [Selaginella moellendorffii]
MGIHQVIGEWFEMFLWVVLEVALIYYLIVLYGLSSLLEDVEEDEVDGLPSNFSDSNCGSSMDSDNDALPKAFYNFLQSRGFGSPAAFGTWMHMKILETKTTIYLACYLRISKPTLYKYMQLVDLNWRGVYYRVPPEETVRRFGRPKHIRSDNAPEHNEVERDMIRCWGPAARSFIRGISTCNQRIEHLWRELFERVVWIMPSVGGKDIENLPGPFLFNVEGATLSEALGTVRNQAFLMHREGLNLDKQYLLHLDLTMECAMADVAGVDLPLYIESALPTATPVKRQALEKLYLAILGEN